MPDENEKFLSRWSRLKRDNNAAPLDVSGTQPLLQGNPPLAQGVTESVPPPLPSLDELTPDSDFSGFFHPKVEQAVKRAALKKLFSDPHFNVMDGLDTYIDDYSKGEELPAAMLAQMKSAQKILRWARNEPDEVEEEKAALPTGQMELTEQAEPVLADQSATPDPVVPAQPDTEAVAVAATDVPNKPAENT